MANIESIKQKILQLDAGSFQNLCDAYLYKSGYPNIVSLGGKAGTRKTTKGTPDTYFNTQDGRYVFVEYTTTLAGLFEKIKDDISKCLDTNKTKIPHMQISEIVYCHTSSSIKPSEDNEARTLCQSVGVNLTIIGIDKLSEDLYLYHHMLVRDFLGISLSTGQIETADNFVKAYNSHTMAAPIDTEFLFRTEEMNKIDTAFDTSDVVILSGVAGTGKTRLALEYAKEYSNKNEFKFYCIRSNALPIHEDLKLFIDTPGNYFLLVDDANQLSSLQHIIQYVTLKPEGYYVKILITVRDYALKKVINDIREFSTFNHIVVNAFSDNEIKKLLDTALGIKNPDYLDRILKITEGNARLAILAGRVACNSNRLDSIKDASQLYDDYYGHFLKHELILESNDLLISAGIVAFLEAIHLDHIEILVPVLNEKGLSKDRFIESIHKLHELEVLDLCHDKAVRFSEQCLSNYLLKHIFFDKKLISLSEMLYLCFPKYKERTIFSINSLLNIFGNKELYYYIENEVKLIWERLQEEHNPHFFEFVKSFFRVNPIKALLIIKDQINKEETVVVEIKNIDIESQKNNRHISNEIISILGGFADMDDLPSALDLFFKYYIKRPDLYIEFYHASNQYFGVTKVSIENDFYTQINFLNKMKDYAVGSAYDHIIILFLEVAKEFLNLHFTPIEGGRKHSFTIRQIPLSESNGSKEYRKFIWEWLYELCENPKYIDKVVQILYTYHGSREEVSASIAQYDLTYIQSIMHEYFLPSELKNCLLAKHLSKIFTSNITPNKSLFDNYFNGAQFKLYSILNGPSYDEILEYDEFQNIKQKAIEKYVLTCDLKSFKNIISLCSDIEDIDSHTKWEISNGLSIVFETIFTKHNYYIDAIEYYISQNTPLNLNPAPLLSHLFSILSEDEVLKLISNHQYKQKNAWLYAFYHELPIEKINKKHLDGLYDFLSQATDLEITSSTSRDVDFLDKYSKLDENVFINGCKIILQKTEYSTFIVDIYFSLLFNKYHNTPQELIYKFKFDLELLSQIYFTQLLNNNHDYDGKFLKEICLIYPQILDTYITFLIDKNNRIVNHHEMLKCFFDLPNFIDIYDKIFVEIVNSHKFPTITVPDLLENILLPIEKEEALLTKQDEWIRHCINIFSNNETEIYCLFAVLSKLKIDRKTKYISQFLESNSSFEDFKKLPLTPPSYICTGSVIPMYSDWLDFLQQLLPNFVGLKWIQHKNYVEEEIDRLRSRIEAEEINEILRG